MLADELDYVIGVDPHRDSHALALVRAASGGVAVEAQVEASAAGYAQALQLANRHAPGRRAWAIEGSGSYGAGLARFLSARGERVLEVGRLRRERRSHAKTDALDAIRTARCVLGVSKLATPRAEGKREALRALMLAREGAVEAKKAALCQLRALLVTCPDPLRGELAALTRARLLARCSRLRPGAAPELAGASEDLCTRFRCVV
jgi:transposase